MENIMLASSLFLLISLVLSTYIMDKKINI